MKWTDSTITEGADDVPEQLIISDVARLAGVTVTTIRQHLRRQTMPPPNGRLGPTPWWYRATIDTWLATRQAPGRPKQPVS